MTLHILASTLDTSTNRITESLNIENDCVLWYRGGTIFQKFSYPGQSITRALLVEFADQEIQFQQTHSNSKCAVIIIADTVYIYDVDGPSYQINLPFTVQRAESYGLGVILERVLSERDPNVQTKFFTLSDPILDLGIAASSSVSAMSTDEELLFVDNSHKSSIYLTNDPASHMVHFYHARYLSNKISKANTKRRSSTRRKSSMVYRTVDSGSEDVSVDLDALGSARDITDYHINRSGDYTGQQVYSATNSQSFSHLTSLRKDIILTHLAKFRINAYTADLKVLSISDEEKEVIAIVNRKTSEATLHTFNKAIGPISLPSIESSQSFEICDIALLGDQSLLFMLSGDGSASIFHPLLNIRSPTIKFSPMSSIIASYSDSSIVVETDKGVHTTIRMKFKPRSELVTMCFKSLELLLDPLSLQYLNFLWDSALFLGSYDDEWVPFMATILSSLLEHKEASLDHVKECSHDILEAIKLSKSLSKSEFGSQFDFSEIKQYIIFSLHLIREEFKLQVSCNGHVQKLGNLLNWLVSQARWSKEWIEYYECKNSVIIPEPINTPPNIYKSLLSYFQPPLIPLVTLGSLGYASSEQESVVFKNIYTIVELFTAISNSHATSDDILNLFDKFKISQKKIDMYPEGVRVPLLEIADFIWNNSHIANGSIPVRSFFAEDMSSTISSNTKDIRSVLQTIGEDTNNLWDGQSESNRIAISRQIFSADRRFYEVSRLLQTSRVQSASLVQPPDLNEHEWMMMQQEIFKATAKRTMSIPFGRAALFFSSRKPLITETYPIPKINFDVSIKPSNIKLSFQRSVLSDESIGWGYFHNGVSAGLSVSRDSSHINGSWVLFNKPANLNSQYSGFLLGLGLNGLLKDLEEYHMYNLLGPKHSYTSIALLLGMTASKLGTKDTKLTKVLSVHVNALLPVGASDLQVSPLVQCAGVIGIGLLYCSTAQRRMSELLVSEILRSRPEMIHSEYDETYRLSAGISFGLINLGKGNSFTSLIDIETIDKLLQLSISAKDIVQGRQKSYDTEPAVCGALFALTLTFLKTNNYEIANKLELPDSELKLSYYRPDSLYLRMLASCLIKWEEIGNTISWVESHIPNVLRMHGPITDMNRLDSDHMVYLNVIAALCTSIGLRYSSTADEHAKSCILYYLDNFMRLAELPVTNYDQTMTKTSINSNIATISFALSTVMVGTGDLDCLRRLRRLYGRNTKDTTFGSHLANQLSLGILFMGGGQYAFNNSDITLAGLLIAFYPLLPSRMKDNISHLQVLRHFWCLGCEPKCVVVRDQNTNEVLPVQVQIRLKNGTEFVQDSPCLLRCEIDDIAKVCIDDSRYFMVELFMDNESDNRLFKDKLLMFIKKKRGDLMRMGNLFELAIDVEEDTKSKGGTAITQFKNVKSFANLDKFRLGSIQSLDDMILALERMAREPASIDDLWNLRLLFAFSDKWKLSLDMKYIPRTSIDRLRALLWTVRTTLK